MRWTITPRNKDKLVKPVLVVGLPGIGNVGKVAADFLIDKLNARKQLDIYSHAFPHSVFVTEENLVDLPTISLYAKKRAGAKRDLLLLGGDVQPTDEEASYEFAEKVLDILKEYGCTEIITLGGIGLPQVPKEPKVYITGNEKGIVDQYAKRLKVEKNLYGVVGPIIGASGLLLGLSKLRGTKAVCFLSETYGHPMYLGIKGARAIVETLNQSLSLGLNVSDMDKEIEELEKEGPKAPVPGKLKKLQDSMARTDMNYIG